MCSLSNEEALKVSDAFLATLYTDEVYQRWVDLKSELGFSTERDFVVWLLDCAVQQSQFVDAECRANETPMITLDESGECEDTNTAGTSGIKKEQVTTGIYNGITGSTYKRDVITEHSTQLIEPNENCYDYESYVRNDVDIDEIRLEQSQSGDGVKCEEGPVSVRVDINEDLYSAADDEPVTKDAVWTGQHPPSSSLAGYSHSDSRRLATNRNVKAGFSESNGPVVASPVLPDVRHSFPHISNLATSSGDNVCKWCEGKFSSLLSLQQHDCPNHDASSGDRGSNHHQQQQATKRRACDHCNYRCNTKQEMRKHLISKHGYSSNYRCPQCGRYFYDRLVLARHIDSCRSKHSVAVVDRQQ